MIFAYNPNVPNPPNNPSVDVGDMHTNAQSIQSIIGIDHITFNAGNNQGNHLQVTFPASEMTPSLPDNVTRIFPQTFNGYLETFTSATKTGGNQINGYLPFVKCMGSYVGGVGPYPATLTPVSNSLNLNIASVVQSTLPLFVGKVFTVTFAQALPFNTYAIFFDGNTNLSSTSVITKNTAFFSVNLSIATGTLQFMVI